MPVACTLTVGNLLPFMIDETPALEQLHSFYVQKSGRVVKFDMRKMEAWRLWGSHGWKLLELGCVIVYLKKLIAQGRKWESSLRFTNLIENVSNFEEILAEARAVGRHIPMPARKAEVLRATGRPTEPEPKARSAAEILAGEKAFEAFRAFKQSL